MYIYVLHRLNRLYKIKLPCKYGYMARKFVVSSTKVMPLQRYINAVCIVLVCIYLCTHICIYVTIFRIEFILLLAIEWWLYRLGSGHHILLDGYIVTLTWRAYCTATFNVHRQNKQIANSTGSFSPARMFHKGEAAILTICCFVE